MKDISIFKGIIEFKTPEGEHLECLNQGAGIWHIYKLQYNAFIMDLACKINGKASCLKLYNQYKKGE